MNANRVWDYKINSAVSFSNFASLVSTRRSYSRRACLKFRMIPTGSAVMRR
jgi:hypothetical protein